MSYRGEDLDLRTPSGRVARDVYAGEAALNGARQRPQVNGNGRADPTYVDETVLACCNHAYDIALAHGASEVRLEHLVHALTRVESAAQILEDRGIREAHLRRESAAVIASEIPVGLGHSQGSPRTSTEFEDVLRRASDLAQPRGTAASVHDLLWVLLNYSRDIPAIALLLRHAADWQQWDWPHRQDQRREPMRTQPYYGDRRPAPAYGETPPPPPPPRIRPDPALQQVSYAQSTYDTGSGRVEQLEGAIRTLQSEMANDRRALADLLRELQRDVKANRGDGMQLPGALMDRLEGVERAVEGRLQELGRTAGALTDRLHSLEKSVSGSLQEGQRNWATVSDRMRNLDQNLSNASGGSALGDLVTEQLVAVADQVRAVTERIGQLERTLSSQTPGGGIQSLRQSFDQQSLAMTSAIAQLTEPVLERLRVLEQGVERRHGEGAQVWRALADRLNQLETGIGTQNDSLMLVAEQSRQSRERDLGEVHDAVLKLGANQEALSLNLEAWRAEQAGDLSIVSNRLELLERASGQPAEILQQLQQDIMGLQQVTLADYDHNRRGFKYWLFGTDDVFAGAWRDETAQVRTRLRQMREDRKA